MIKGDRKMGLFDIVGSIFSSVADSASKNMERAARDYERQHPNMTSEEREKLNRMHRQIDSFNRKADMVDRATAYGKEFFSDSSSSDSSSSTDRKYLGKTVDEWDCRWKSIGKLKSADLSSYNHCVGLYRHVINGETMYVGRAIELHNGGFRKRLSDYRRDSDSARKHTSGRVIHEHLDEIVTYILVVGSNPEAIEATKKLEGEFVRRYSPPWNKMVNI